MSSYLPGHEGDIEYPILRQLDQKRKMGTVTRAGGIRHGG